MNMIRAQIWAALAALKKDDHRQVEAALKTALAMGCEECRAYKAEREVTAEGPGPVLIPLGWRNLRA